MQSQACHHPKRPAACHQGLRVEDGTALQGASGPRITCSCTTLGPSRCQLWAGAGKRSWCTNKGIANALRPLGLSLIPLLGMPIPCQLTPMQALGTPPPPPPLAWTFWALCELTRVDRATHRVSRSSPHCLLPHPAAAIKSPPASCFSQHLKQLGASTTSPRRAWALPGEGAGRGPAHLTAWFVGRAAGCRGRRSADAAGAGTGAGTRPRHPRCRTPGRVC